MQSTSEGNLLEIIDLAHSLRQEHLYITNEQNTFNNLNETLARNSSNVAQLAWICAQQRQNLNSLILSRPDTGPSACCQKANILENTRFIDAHKSKSVKYLHVIAYVDLFNFLHRSPHLLAQSLSIGDRIARISNDQMNSVVHTIATGIYGNAILSKDVDMVLRLLRELIEIQVVNSENPRRMLRAGSCAFSRLYHRLHESLFSAKLFLTSALYEPIMKVLIEDEVMLDVDPTKTVSSYAQKDRLRKFGIEGTAEYDAKFQKYRRETIDTLYQLAMRFIQSLADNWSLFPSTLRWVVQTMWHLLKKTNINYKEINDILTDMVFTNFICPAVVSPDLFGISDAPISETARFNLIQIGQILQMFALIKHEDIDTKFLDLFELFDRRDIVAELIEQLLETEYDVSVSMMAIPHQNDFGRCHVLVTQSELNVFVAFLRSVLENDGLIVSGEDRRKLGKILDQLPDKWETMLNGGNGCAGGAGEQQLHGVSTIAEPSPRQAAKQSLINLGKSTKSKITKTMSLATHNNSDCDEGGACYASANGSSVGGIVQCVNNNNCGGDERDQVLVFPITINEESKFQLLTEQEVLNMNNISNEIEAPLTDKNIDNLDKVLPPPFDKVGAVLRTQRKHTRFSVSNDDQSIGNTSDNLEAVSEAQSNHSVTSSLELEENDQNLNDNLSDMVSANVSGRGSPNISGRDTPSSQVTEGDNPPIPTPQMAKILSKARSDIDDKFCKFEIKKLVEGDETISIISDTWSTDVLASDSETIEPSDAERNFSTPLIPSSVVLPGDNNFDSLANATGRLRSNFLEASSDTRSESAWSTDVLASDSEKLAEIDTDDNQSIAAKSDTTDAGRSESELARDVDTSAVNGRAPDSPFFAPRIPNTRFRAPDLLPFAARASGDAHHYLATVANRNFDDASPRINDDLSRFLLSSPGNGSVGGSTPAATTRFPSSARFSDNGLLFRSSHYLRDSDSSYYASNVTANRNGGMHRQNSSESSISNQSLNTDDGSNALAAAAVAVAAGNAMQPVSMSLVRNITFEQSSTLPSMGNTGAATDLPSTGLDSPKAVANHIGEIIVKSSTNLMNPFSGGGGGDVDSSPDMILFTATPPLSVDDSVATGLVQQRHAPLVERNVSFDGRRNGMSSFTSSVILPKTKTRHTTHNVGNYENVEIIAPKTVSLQPFANVPANLLSAATDDDKQQQLQQDELALVVQKTLSLSLADGSAAAASSATTVSAKSKDVEADFVETEGEPSRVPQRYTGAIPKSISFDASADKTDHRNYLRRHDSAASASVARGNGSGFFNKIKQGFKNRRSNKPRSDDFTSLSLQALQARSVIGLTDDAGATVSFANGPLENGFIETTEDILAKYRRKISSSSETTNSDSVGLNRKSSQSDIEQRNENLMDEGPFIFANAKRKLRLVLSTTDLHTADFRHTSCHKTPPLLTYLQIQLAQALNLQNLQQIAFISEAIRCVKLLTEDQQQQLIVNLQQDLIDRQSYLQYLMRYRQHLLSALENIDRFEDRLRNDRDMCNRHLIMVCVKMFMEKRDQIIEQFQHEFGALTVVDEKIDFMDEFMGKLMDELANDGILSGMADLQLQEARICIERMLLQRLYRQVMFPNDDGDIDRDEVLRQHIVKLGRVITPAHAALRIPQEFLMEAPWPFAQRQISYISAYKTPREKVQCVVRCITSIMNLLQMASNRDASADDLVPVLIYVVIMANPPYLLSTIQYVNAFIGDKLEGEDHYWWTQFSSAVTFIKTMDYRD